MSQRSSSRGLRPSIKQLEQREQQLEEELREATPELSEELSLAELEQIFRHVKEAARRYFEVLDSIIAKYKDIGGNEEAAEHVKSRFLIKNSTNLYLKHCNNLICRLEGTSLSVISSTTHTSNLSQSEEATRRKETLRKYLAAKAAASFDASADQLELVRKRKEREVQRQQQELEEEAQRRQRELEEEAQRRQRELMEEAQRMQRELARQQEEEDDQIELQRRELERKKQQGILAAEISAMSEGDEDRSPLDVEEETVDDRMGRFQGNTPHLLTEGPEVVNSADIPKQTGTIPKIFKTFTTFPPTQTVAGDISKNYHSQKATEEEAPADATTQKTSGGPAVIGFRAPYSSLFTSGSPAQPTPGVPLLPKDPLCSSWKQKPVEKSQVQPQSSPHQPVLQQRPQGQHRPIFQASGSQHSPLAVSQPPSQPDSTALYLRKEKLFDKPSKPFTGAGQEDRYYTWAALLNHRLQGLDLSSIELIGILEAQTAGEANKLVTDYFEACGGNPEDAMDQINAEMLRRYGSGNKIAESLNKKISNFGAIKNDGNVGKRLQDLAQLCKVLLNNLNHIPELQCLNYANGLMSIRTKLPEHLQNRWRKTGTQYMSTHWNTHPPFSHFVDFLEKLAIEFTNNEFAIPRETNTTSSTNNSGQQSRKSRAMQTRAVSQERQQEPDGDEQVTCTIHNSTYHSIEDCRQFKNMALDERAELARKDSLCYRCLGPHFSSHCQADVSCGECGSKKHNTLLHKDNNKGHEDKGRERRKDQENKTGQPNWSHTAANKPNNVHSKSKEQEEVQDKEKTTTCTSFCGRPGPGKSCSKTLLVDLKAPGMSNKTLRCYTILDEQSDTTFADSAVFDFFGVHSNAEEYTLSTLTGESIHQEGRIFKGLTVKGVGEKQIFELPKTFENAHIPNTKNEVATPSIVKGHRHLAKLANNFNELDEAADVLLLIGRDGGDLLKTEAFGVHHPFAHHTSLGWAVVGRICPNAQRETTSKFRTMRTSLEHQDHFKVTRSFASQKGRLLDVELQCGDEESSTDIFQSLPDDELPGASQDDQRFLEIIGRGIHVNEQGNLEMPLPFREEQPHLPSNQTAVYKRTQNTLNRLKSETHKLDQCLKAMGKTIAAKHVEKVPASEQKAKDGQAWWLPVFPVTHPKKGKVRLVFDSSASYHNTCLNNELLQGPDQNNRLRGVLTRFREDEVAFVADVEAMFHSFHLNEEHRNFLRFYWFEDNNPDNPIVQYRAKVHIFGNRPSPAVATFGLKHATDQAENASEAAKAFLKKNVYVDDGLGCAATPDQAISVLVEAREILAAYNIRMHKIASSSPAVMEAFPESERAEDLVEINLDEAPMQRTLGVTWNVQRDSFVMNVAVPDKPFTKRGILSVVNSVFDPIGVAGPVVLAGRLFQRQVLSAKAEELPELAKCDWDDPLPKEYQARWKAWVQTLSQLETLEIPRSFCKKGFGRVLRQDVHVFSDASKDAIGYALYLRSINEQEEVSVALLFGNSRVAPRSATSIPRLELCAAAEASQAVQEAVEELTRPPDNIYYYTDSKVVLGYLLNKEKRFARYVTRRINLILATCKSEQWQYIATELNPADMASRPHDPKNLAATCWLKGPEFLWTKGGVNPSAPKYQPLESCDLPEIEDTTKVLATSKDADNVPEGPFAKMSVKVSSWRRQVNIVKRIINLCRRLFNNVVDRLGKGEKKVEATRQEAELVLLKEVQAQTLPRERITLKKGNQLPHQNKLSKLSPVLDEQGIVRVGGRLKRGQLPFDTRHPVLLPEGHLTSLAILRHYHEQVHHQGRHLTHGALREAGFHLENGRKIIRDFLAKCPPCLKLRGKLETQLMSDLPPDRLEQVPPFSNVGLDVFGPWTVKEGQSTRRHSSSVKVWALMLTCLVTRGVHVEMLPAMDIPSFRNALRRFLAIRGACKVIRSDRGTNFTGTLNQDEKEMDMEEVKKEFEGKDLQWILNPPHASHFGGVWERKIGSVRRVLEGIMLKAGGQLSRDDLHTLLQEAAAIVNATPLWEVSHDPNDPFPLTPATLMTLKEEPHPPMPTVFTEQDVLAYGKRRWRRVQFLADQFWREWRQSYLQALQGRRKWLAPKRSIEAGDLVLLREKNTKRNNWPAAMVKEVKESQDGLVRKVILDMIKVKEAKNKTEKINPKIERKSFERPIHELVLLVPNEDK